MNPLLIRRREMLQARQHYDAEIQYLRSDGSGQYINTLIPYDSTMVIDARIRRRTPTSGGYFFGLVAGFGGVIYRWGINRGANAQIKPHFGTVTNVTASFSLNVWHNVWCDYNTLVVDTTTTTTTASPFNPQTPVPLYLYARDNSGSYAETFAECDIATFKIEKGGAVVRDFIPVRVGTVGYMYDRVSGQLFGNAGTGAFVLGPDVQ